MVIRVAEIVERCYTYEDGLQLLKIMDEGLESNNQIQVSFKGVTAVSSSFINGAFVPLLDKIGFDAIRERIQVMDSNKIINNLIKSRIINESNRRGGNEAASREIYAT